MNLLAPSQVLLLKAAFLRGEPSLAAWQEWMLLSDWEHTYIDPGSYALLPLIYSNLNFTVSAVDKNSQSFNRLHGIYRHTWVANQTSFRRLEAALKLLAAAGIPALLPDSAALALQYYESHACRPVKNQTVWVRMYQALAATRCLRKIGWQAVSRLPEPLAAMRNLIRQSWPLCHESGHILCVRGRLWSDRERALWVATRPIRVGASSGLALDPTEQFLYLSVQALRAGPDPALPFLADAAQLLSSSAESLDWTRLLHHTAARAILNQLTMIGAELKEITMPKQAKNGASL